MRKVMQEQEQVSVLGAGPVVTRDMSERPTIQGNQVVADAVREPPRRVRARKAQEEDDEGGLPPAVQRYRVLKGGVVHDPGGFRARLAVGKEIDSLNYDVEALRRQGIELQELPA